MIQYKLQSNRNIIKQKPENQRSFQSEIQKFILVTKNRHTLFWLDFIWLKIATRENGNEEVYAYHNG